MPEEARGQLPAELRNLYEVVREHGEGGFGRVLEVWARLDGRAYALKLIPPWTTPGGPSGRSAPACASSTPT